MAININGVTLATNINAVVVNGAPVTKVVLNGNTVWEFNNSFVFSVSTGSEFYICDDSDVTDDWLNERKTITGFAGIKPSVFEQWWVNWSGSQDITIGSISPASLYGSAVQRAYIERNDWTRPSSSGISYAFKMFLASTSIPSGTYGITIKRGAYTVTLSAVLSSAANGFNISLTSAQYSGLISASGNMEITIQP